MSKHYACLCNGSSGSAVAAEEITKTFTDLGAQVDCLSIHIGQTELRRAVQRREYAALVAAGGDGTVNAAARLAIDAGLPLGVLPVGTLNHFAKDAGLPLDFEEAAKTVVQGRVVRVDYGTVNDRLFVNNSSLGIYPSTVLGREQKSGLGKWPAAVVAFMAALFTRHTVRVRLQTPHGLHNFRSPLVFIGNNEYHLEKVGFTKRERLDQGKLLVYVVRASQPMSLILIGLLSLFGMRRRRHDYRELTAGPVTLWSAQRSVKVATDGEVATMQFPLHYEVHAKGLALLVPPDASGP